MLRYFYSQNEFLFKDNGDDLVKGLTTWIEAIGEVNYSHIEKLYVISSGDLEAYVADRHKKRAFPFLVLASKHITPGSS
jgi:hypothetical protein